MRAAQAGQRRLEKTIFREAVEKIAALRQMGAPALQWHCIGPVQSNKTRLVAEHFDWMHTADRAKIAERLAAQRPAHRTPLQVCIQVNVDGGLTKSGVAPDEALALAQTGGAATVVSAWCDEHSRTAADYAAQLAIVNQRVRAVFDRIRTSGQPGLEHFDTLSLGNDRRPRCCHCPAAPWCVWAPASWRKGAASRVSN